MRLEALDKLRALAAISMIQGHTFTALLAPDALPSLFMRLHALLHGLTAPAFLFGAGLAFGVASYPRYALHRVVGDALFRRLRRYALLLAVGYALQLPGSSLIAALRLREHELEPVLRVGPLQLVALCLTLCQLGALLLRSPRAHASAAFGAGILIMAAAPWVWDGHAAAASPIWLAPWLDGRTGSLFPIFPWASYLFYGVGCAGLVTSVRGVRPSALALVGATLALASYALFLHGVRLAPAQWFWHASPLHTLFRTGLVTCLFALLHVGRRRTGPAPWRARVSLLARHSLTAYVAHLLLLYGTPLSPSLVRHVGGRLSALEASATFVAVLTLTLAAIHLQLWLREQRARSLVRFVRLGISLVVAAIVMRA